MVTHFFTKSGTCVVFKKTRFLDGKQPGRQGASPGGMQRKLRGENIMKKFVVKEREFAACPGCTEDLHRDRKTCSDSRVIIVKPTCTGYL